MYQLLISNVAQENQQFTVFLLIITITILPRCCTCMKVMKTLPETQVITNSFFIIILLRTFMEKSIS